MQVPCCSDIVACLGLRSILSPTRYRGPNGISIATFIYNHLSPIFNHLSPVYIRFELPCLWFSCGSPWGLRLSWHVLFVDRVCNIVIMTAMVVTDSGLCLVTFSLLSLVLTSFASWYLLYSSESFSVFFLFFRNSTGYMLHGVLFHCSRVLPLVVRDSPRASEGAAP